MQAFENQPPFLAWLLSPLPRTTVKQTPLLRRVERTMEPSGMRYPIHELLRLRWSPLAFSTKPIEPDKLCSLFEAARRALSSYNEQRWSFLVATRENMEEFETLLHCLVQGNAV
jgi:hypothetical protein